MRLLKVMVLVALLVSGCGTKTAAETESPPKQDQAQIAAEQCVAPWGEAVLSIVRRTHDSDAAVYLKILQNSPIVRTVVNNGHRQGWADPPKDESVSFVYLQSICSQEDDDAFAARKDFLASYLPDKKAIQLRLIDNIPPDILGLVLLHEMRHAHQFAMGFSLKGTDREIDAYSFEFMVFDKLALPGYHEFIASESARMHGQEIRELEASPYDSRMAAMFPGVAKGSLAEGIVRTELFFRSVFAHLDADYPANQALKKKREFMKSVGYSD